MRSGGAWDAMTARTGALLETNRAIESPLSGQVLGIDVGFAESARTTCFCVLQWTPTTARLEFRLATAVAADRSRALSELALASGLVGVAIDGPLTRGLRLVSHYRATEAILSGGVLQNRGKPGQTSSPVGQTLHRHATHLAALVWDSVPIEVARHCEPIHQRCIVEAFPNAFLAAMIDECDIPALNRDASDQFWEVAVDRLHVIDNLVSRLLPGRRLLTDLSHMAHHEVRAGIVCALTAFCIVSGRYVAVGDAVDGDIILPPRDMWGSDHSGECWLEAVLRANLWNVRSRRIHSNHRTARIVTPSECWLPFRESNRRCAGAHRTVPSSLPSLPPLPRLRSRRSHQIR